MQVESEGLYNVIASIMESLFRYNPFFTIYYNPLIRDPRPEATEKPYYNYVHQIALLLDTIPRRRVRLLIGDEVGLGKTIEAIRVVKYLATLGETRRILIIAPKSLIRQWLVHEIRDLLHVPGRVKRLTKRTFEDVKIALQAPSREPIIILASIDLVKRGELDRHGSGRFSPYYELVAGVNWDLVIVDEAHQISFIASKPTLRTARLAPLCERAKHLLLLSATPSRGTHRDFLLRLSLIDPELRKHVKTLHRDVGRRKLLYDAVSGFTVYRRTKEHVNLLEGRRVFTDVKSFMALIRLGEYRSLYDELGYVVGMVLKALEDKAPGLVKVILLKRAISSPHAFLLTLKRVIEKRAEEVERGEWRPVKRLSDRVLENRADAVIAEYLSRIADKLPEDVLEKTVSLLMRFGELYDDGDPALKALVHIIYSTLENQHLIPRELVGDYIVFTEYKDTVDYLFEKIQEFFKEMGYEEDDHIPLRLVEHVQRKLEERGLFEVNLKKYLPSILRSTAVLSRNTKRLVVLKISSENQEVIPLIPFLIEAVDEIAGGTVRKVLLSTDVASEGLNLHYFNVVVNYETPWSPVRREQRVGRVHRLRQKRDCALLDFVRDTRVDYEFYTKLVLKLLEMATQKIAVKPVSGLLEIHYLEKTADHAGESRPFISEKSIGLYLVEAYKKYYVEKNVVGVDATYAELARKLKEHLEVYGELTPKYEEAASTREYVADFTGCEDMHCFEETIRSLHSLVHGSLSGDISQILVELYNALLEERTVKQGSYVLIVNDESVEEGYIGFLELNSEGVKRYETPILAVKQRGEWKVYHGIQVVKWIVSAAKTKGLLVLQSETPISQSELKDLKELADKYASRLNLWIRERLESKEKELTKLLGSRERIILRLNWHLRGPVFRVLPGISRIADYEKSIREIPLELRKWMEEVSVNFIEELFTRKGCRTIEKNIGIPKPFDLLMECTENGETKTVKVEVKSHLKKAFLAVLTPSETREADKDPDNYYVCNVAGLENPDPSAWITICGIYSKLPIRKVVEVEEYAVVDFTEYTNSVPGKA